MHQTPGGAAAAATGARGSWSQRPPSAVPAEHLLFLCRLTSTKCMRRGEDGLARLPRLIQKHGKARFVGRDNSYCQANLNTFYTQTQQLAGVIMAAEWIVLLSGLQKGFYLIMLNSLPLDSCTACKAGVPRDLPGWPSSLARCHDLPCQLPGCAG